MRLRRIHYNRLISVGMVLLQMMLFGICFDAPARAQSEPIISRIDVDIRDAVGDTTEMADRAIALIYLEAGEPFSDKAFRDSVEALKNSGLFSAIDIPDPNWSADRITLTFRLTPFRRIKEIHVDGAFPLLRREILNQMTFYTGDAYNPKKVPEQSERIAELLRREGYIDPQVKVRAEEDAADGNYVVFVEIDKGDFFHISSVDMDGNDAFSNLRLKLRTNTWQSSLLPGEMKRFVQADLDEDVENLTEFYRKKGFAEVAIDAKVEKDDESASAKIRLNIDEGPKYKIDFEGNDAFWGFTLRKDLVLKKQGNVDGLGLRRSVRNVEERFKKAGYLKSEVAVEEAETEAATAEDDSSVREIDIVIDQGPQFIVDEVVIEGNETVPAKEIRGAILTRPPGLFHRGGYALDVLEADIRAIRTVYLKYGFLSPTIEDRVDWTDIADANKKRARIVLTIDEGVRTLVGSVDFKGLTVFGREDALEKIDLSPGEPYREYMLRSDANALASAISEKGYPHVTIEPEANLSDDRTRAGITYTVTEGPYTEMGEVLVTGNFRTKQRVFLRELEIEPGEPFSLTRMLEAQRNIRNIDALESADFKALGLKEQAERVHLLIDAEEKKPFFFEIGGGYDTYRKLYLHSRVGDRNLFGMNRDAWIGAELSQIGYRGEAAITEPRFVGTRISATATMYAEEREEFNKDFGVRSYGASVAFIREFWEHFTANLAFRYEFREQYQIDDDPIPLEDQEQFDPRNIVVTTPTIMYNSTNSFIRPTKGLFAWASVDISNGLGDSLDNFFKYRVEGRYYFTPVERITFALRARYGYIDPFDDDSTVPDDQLFFLGGTRDVRGFDENRLRFDETGDPLGGREEMLGSIELRYDLGGNLELATFYDVGAVREPEVDEGEDEFRSSVGLGLRYITPIGPVGLLYGWNLDNREGESGGKFHFSIGYTF